MADADLLPPTRIGATPVVEPPAPPVADGRLKCEFCECQLTAGGQILRYSERGKKFRDLSFTLDERDRKIADLEGELTRLRADNAAVLTEVNQFRAAAGKKPWYKTTL